MLRDLGTIETELRMLVAIRLSEQINGARPSTERMDELLDEWNRAYACLRSYGVRFWPDRS